MKLINHVRDNVIRLARNPSGTNWPTCAKCWQPVEEYGTEETGRDYEVVYAKCRHTTLGEDSNEKDYKRITMKHHWSVTKKSKERSRLVFFVPSAATPLNAGPGDV